MKKEFVIPKIDIPFTEDNRALKVEKAKLISMIAHFSRDGRYKLPSSLKSDYSVRKMLLNNPTLCKRIREEQLPLIDRTIYKVAA